MYQTRKRDLIPQSSDLLLDLQRYMQDFKSRSTIDHAVKRLTSIIERPHPGLPRAGSFMKIYVFNMLAHLKKCLLSKYGDSVLQYTCLYTARNRRDYFSENQRESLDAALTEAEQYHGPWLRDAFVKHNGPSSSSSSHYDVPPPPSPSPPSNHSSPSHFPPPSPPPPRNSSASMPMITSTLIHSSAPISPSHYISPPSSYAGTSVSIDSELPSKRKFEPQDLPPSKIIKQEPSQSSSSDFSISTTVLSQAAESLKQAKAVAQSAKDMTVDCNTRIKSLVTRVDDDDKRVKREMDTLKSRQGSVQNLVEHMEAKFYELEKSVRYLEERNKENEKTARRDNDRLKALEAQIAKLIQKTSENNNTNNTPILPSNTEVPPVITPSLVSAQISTSQSDTNTSLVKNSQDNPQENGFFAFV